MDTNAGGADAVKIEFTWSLFDAEVGAKNPKREHASRLKHYGYRGTIDNL